MRALDRLLISGRYVVPLYVQQNAWLAYEIFGLRRPDPRAAAGGDREV